MDKFDVDQNQFMKQVRERAEVLSKNARRNPNEVAEKVSKCDEEDEEMKDYLQVIRSTEKKDSEPAKSPRKMENDDLDLDFASHLASSVQLDFSKERFKADLAQRRVQKRRRPQSWAWVATTENESVKLRDHSGSSNSTLNVTIEMDEAIQPEEVPKKAIRPPNRFSSPIFNEKLMSDLGSALNKKKSPLAKPKPSVPPKSQSNKSDSLENIPSQPLKSKSPVSPPQSVSPLTPRSESPISQKNLQKAPDLSRSPSPHLVLVTEKDVFGVRGSPILHRRLQDDSVQQLPLDPTSLQPHGNDGKTESESIDKSTSIIDKASDNLNRKVPPPKPRVKPKTGQSSAMLLKNAAEQSKVDVTKGEEVPVVKTKPNWLEELQKKKMKQEKGPPTQKLNENWISSGASQISKDEPKEEPLTKAESPTGELPAWMKLEFSKLKHKGDSSESEEPNHLLQKGQERDIDSLLKKSKTTTPTKPSWMEELNARKKKQPLVSDTILKESQHFDYRSHENAKQHTEGSEVDEECEIDGTVNSISDIKEKLSKKNTGNELQHVIKKPVVFKKCNDELLSEKEPKGDENILGKRVASEPTRKQEMLTGDGKRNTDHSEQRESDSESKVFVMKASDVSCMVEENGKDKIVDGYSVANGSDIFQGTDIIMLEGGHTLMSGNETKDTPEGMNNRDKNDSKTEKLNDKENSVEICYVENNDSKSRVAEINQQDSVMDIDKRSTSRYIVDSNVAEFVSSCSEETRGVSIPKESKDGSCPTVDSNRMDIGKLDRILKEEVDKSKIVKPFQALDSKQIDKDGKKIDGVYSLEAPKVDQEKPDDSKDKLLSDSKVIEEVDLVGFSGSIERSSAVLSSKVVGTSALSTDPESYSDTELGKNKEKEEDRTMFSKPLRRKLVHINSFEQRALSEHASSDGQKKTLYKASDTEESCKEPKSTVDIEKPEDIKSKVHFGDQKFGNEGISIAKEQNLRRIDPENSQQDNRTTNNSVYMDMKTKFVDGESCGKDVQETKYKKEIDVEDTRIGSVLVEKEKQEGKAIVFETSNDSDKIDASGLKKQDDSKHLRGKTDISMAISDVAKEPNAREKELFDSNRSIPYKNYINLDNNKEDLLDSKKKISSLEEEKSLMPSKKKPPAPKPKPKPRVPLKPSKEVVKGQQQDDVKDQFIKFDAESEVDSKKAEVTQKENIKNIENSRKSSDSGSSKEELNERIKEHKKEGESDKKAIIRTRNEYKPRTNRPVSMFENFTSVDRNVPVRERKFSGVSSGTKFANELERKQKTCWFRGALDTNDIKAIDAYNGDDDMPAWKRQLLARLKSNENSSAKKLEKGQAMDNQQRDEVSHFRNRTVTSPDGLSAHKKMSQITAKKSPIIEEAVAGSSTSENEGQERPVPAFLLEFASKKQLKSLREVVPQVIQDEKKETQKNSRAEEFV